MQYNIDHGTDMRVWDLAYTKVTKKMSAAVFMGQIVFCNQHNPHPEGWFYKTASQWKKEMGMTRTEVETNTKILVKIGWVEHKVSGLPPKSYYRITKKFNDWWCKRPTKEETEQANKSISDFLQIEEGGGANPANLNPISCKFKSDFLHTNKGVIIKDKNTNKTSLSVCEQTDRVDVLVEAEKCLPKGQINKEQLMFRWNEIAEKLCFKTHRIFNTAWEKNLAKANKMILNFSKDGWEEFFRCVSEIMNSYQGTQYVKYFDLGFALRPEKFQDIMEENVKFPIRYDKAVIKRIIAGLKAKNEKLSVQIQKFDAKGDKKMMMKKHKRWKTNREAISKWQEILIGESK